MQWIGDTELDKKQVSLLLLPMSQVMQAGYVLLLEEALTKSPNLDYATDDRCPEIIVA